MTTLNLYCTESQNQEVVYFKYETLPRGVTLANAAYASDVVEWSQVRRQPRYNDERCYGKVRSSRGQTTQHEKCSCTALFYF